LVSWLVGWLVSQSGAEERDRIFYWFWHMPGWSEKNHKCDEKIRSQKPDIWSVS